MVVKTFCFYSVILYISLLFVHNKVLSFYIFWNSHEKNRIKLLLFFSVTLFFLNIVFLTFNPVITFDNFYLYYISAYKSITLLWSIILWMGTVVLAKGRDFLDHIAIIITIEWLLKLKLQQSIEECWALFWSDF